MVAVVFVGRPQRARARTVKGRPSGPPEAETRVARLRPVPVYS